MLPLRRQWRLNASDPDWSPNGKKIAFDSGDDGGQTDGGGNIHVMRADGSGRKKLTDYPTQDEFPPRRPGLANNPVWSPSGNQIMFAHFLPKEIKLDAMKPNGWQARRGRGTLRQTPFPEQGRLGHAPLAAILPSGTARPLSGTRY